MSVKNNPFLPMIKNWESKTGSYEEHIKNAIERMSLVYLPSKYDKQRLDNMDKTDCEMEVCLAITGANKISISEYSVVELFDFTRSEYLLISWWARTLLLKKDIDSFDFEKLSELYYEYDHAIENVDWNLQDMKPLYNSYYSVYGYSIMDILLKYLRDRLPNDILTSMSEYEDRFISKQAEKVLSQKTKMRNA